MKKAIQWTLAGLVGWLWLFPLLAALFDGACWFFVSQQCTAIEWNGARAGIVAGWTIGVPLLAAAIVGA